MCASSQTSTILVNTAADIARDEIIQIRSKVNQSKTLLRENERMLTAAAAAAAVDHDKSETHLDTTCSDGSGDNIIICSDSPDALLLHGQPTSEICAPSPPSDEHNPAPISKRSKSRNLCDSVSETKFNKPPPRALHAPLSIPQVSTNSTSVTSCCTSTSMQSKNVRCTAASGGSVRDSFVSVAISDQLTSNCNPNKHSLYRWKWLWAYKTVIMRGRIKASIIDLFRSVHDKHQEAKLRIEEARQADYNSPMSKALRQLDRYGKKSGKGKAQAPAIAVVDSSEVSKRPSSIHTTSKVVNATASTLRVSSSQSRRFSTGNACHSNMKGLPSAEGLAHTYNSSRSRRKSTTDAGTESSRRRLQSAGTIPSSYFL